MIANVAFEYISAVTLYPVPSFSLNLPHLSGFGSISLLFAFIVNLIGLLW